jgi:alpha-glucosidase
MAHEASQFPFVTVRDFTPNHGDWTPVGAIAAHSRSGNVFALRLASDPGLSVQLSFLSPTCFRVRFSPTPGADYTRERSVAVVERDLGPVSLAVTEDPHAGLRVDTGAMRVEVGLSPYRVRVYTRTQLVHADEPRYNLVYIPGKRVVANFKSYPRGARYCGLGEKAGANLLRNEFTFTQFNFDNFNYSQSPLPQDNGHGPLNPSEALYCSIPLLVENNPSPAGEFAGAPYSCGVFFDNPAQSYFNVGTNDYSDMTGKYYFGALFGDLDYYFFLGPTAAGVLAQYTRLTGRAPMPPRYVFGYHQGAYGYYNKERLEAAARGFRQAHFPIDGLHIDVDFQNNYRTFTHSERKFPGAKKMLEDLRRAGFKCSTNITPFFTKNPYNELAREEPYAQLEALRAVNGILFDTRAGHAVNPNWFVGTVNYGLNRKVNPDYAAYFPLAPNADGNLPLRADGHYPDLGRADVREAWGRQYQHLVKELGLEMVWQDMTCPALDIGPDTPWRTFPLDLMVNDGLTYAPNATCHNAYALLLLMATWEGLRKLRPEKRNFIIARGGYAGAQRYAALWTGDSGSTWAFLRVNVPEVLNLGLSGVPLAGCDVGGFANVGDPDGTPDPPQFPGGRVVGGITNYELLTRWMQVGSFLPWFRNHYDGYNKEFQEPYRYGEPVPTNCRKYVELRYRMLQLYYDAMYEWTQTGMPIARALFLNEPADLAVYAHLDDQFFVGKDLLVAPLLGQFDSLPVRQQPRRDIYLPQGSRWYEFTDGAPLRAPLDGGTTLRGYAAGLDAVPLFVRAGAILPLRGLEQYVGELPRNPLTLTVYPGAAGGYLLYQDDGVSTRAEQNGEYRTTRVSHEPFQGGRRVRVAREHDRFTPPETFYRVALLGSAAPQAVTLNGAALANAGSAAALDASPVSAYYHDGAGAATVVKVIDQGDAAIEVRG